MKLKVPKLRLPDEVRDWMEASRVDECGTVFAARSEDGPPSITLVRDDEETQVLKAWAEQMRDGLHFYVTPHPGESTALHLALRRAPPRVAKMSVTAGLAAALAERFHGPLQGLPRSEVAQWMKKAHAQILRTIEKNGSAAFGEVGDGFLTLNRECMHLVDRVLNKDVEEAAVRVRKDFLLLVDHHEEEDVVRWWRESIVEKIHDS